MDFYLLQVTKDTEITTRNNGTLKKGYARIDFLDIREDGKPQSETYDLRGLPAFSVKFQNWAKKEFGYLRYEVVFGR